MAFNSDALRARLKAAGKTQLWLAAAVRKTPRQISRWLNGSPPRDKDLQAIAAALGCSPEDFDPRFTAEGLGDVPIHAHISVAAHNAYEAMRLRYGVTQKDIVELAPVLFSIVAGHALRVPDQDKALKRDMERLGFDPRRLAGSADDETGSACDEQAALAGRCFGSMPRNPGYATPRNLFQVAMRRLSDEIGADVAAGGMPEADPGAAPAILGFNVDVRGLAELTGNDPELIEAVTRGRIRLSKCLEDFKSAREQTPAAFRAILHRALKTSDKDHARQIAEKRAQGLIELEEWRAFYAARHPADAAEYDRIVAAHCHEDGWYPSWYGDQQREDCWTRPYLEDRHIDDKTLPDLQKKNAETHDGIRVHHFAHDDPIVQRFGQLEAHRSRVKKAFEAARGVADHV